MNSWQHVSYLEKFHFRVSQYRDRTRMFTESQVTHALNDIYRGHCFMLQLCYLKFQYQT